jgi:hypothetical protein
MDLCSPTLPCVVMFRSEAQSFSDAVISCDLWMWVQILGLVVCKDHQHRPMVLNASFGLEGKQRKKRRIWISQENRVVNVLATDSGLLTNIFVFFLKLVYRFGAFSIRLPAKSKREATSYPTMGLFSYT